MGPFGCDTVIFDGSVTFLFVGRFVSTKNVIFSFLHVDLFAVVRLAISTAVFEIFRFKNSK